MTIKELLTEAHTTALAKGWWKKTPTGELEVRDIEEQLCLFHSEVSEALEAYRDPKHKPNEIWFGEDDKPEGVGIELADLLIRLADSSQANKVAFDEDFLSLSLHELEWNFSIQKVTSYFQSIHNRISELGKVWIRMNGFADTKGLVGSSGFIGSIEHVWESLFDMVGMAMREIGNTTDCSSDFVERCVVTKLTYNQGRPFRHGDKRC
jgi:hypothetical protein